MLKLRNKPQLTKKEYWLISPAFTRTVLALYVLISILDKAIFAVRTEIKQIKKHIAFTELKEDAAFDAVNKENKLSKTEYEKMKKFYITNKTFEYVYELEELKTIEEFGELELKRIIRMKEEFSEFNMNVKKKYRLMV